MVPRLLRALAPALLLAGALRLYDLGGASLWMDEGFTWMMARVPLADLPHSGLSIEKHPPLYYALVHALLAFGPSEWAIRLPAAVAGIAAVAAVFFLAREAYGPREALLASLLLAVSALHALMSRDGRGYSLAGFFLLVATLCWLRLLRAPDAGRGTLLGWYAAAVLAVYTHYLAFFVLGIQWGVGMLVDRRRGRWVALAALLAASYLPWIPIVLAQARTPSPGHYPPGLEAVGDVLFTQAAGFCLNFRTMTWWYAIAALSAGLALWPAAVRDAPSRMLAALYVGTIAAIMGVSRATGLGLFETRYTVLVTPLFCVLAARALVLLGERTRWASAALLLFLAAINLTSSYNSIALEEWRRQDFRWAAALLQSGARPGDLILLEPDWAVPALAFYAPGVDAVPLGARQAVAFSPPHPLRRAWLVRADASLSDPADRVKHLLDARYPPPKEWTARRRNPTFDVHVTLYEPPSP